MAWVEHRADVRELLDAERAEGRPPRPRAAPARARGRAPASGSRSGPPGLRERESASSARRPHQLHGVRKQHGVGLCVRGAPVVRTIVWPSTWCTANPVDPLGVAGRIPPSERASRSFRGEQAPPPQGRHVGDRVGERGRRAPPPRARAPFMALAASPAGGCEAISFRRRDHERRPHTILSTPGGTRGKPVISAPDRRSWAATGDLQVAGGGARPSRCPPPGLRRSATTDGPLDAREQLRGDLVDASGRYVHDLWPPPRPARAPAPPLRSVVSSGVVLEGLGSGAARERPRAPLRRSGSAARDRSR